jgi:hypothetical protein
MVIGDSQKAQIRDSLRDAFKNIRPRLWILCLNMNLDVKAARWFERLQQSYKSRGLLVADRFEATDIARELLFRRTLRSAYFPNAVLNVNELKALMMAASRGLHSIDDATLEKLATEDAEQWLDRFRDKDPRFFYEITFAGERGPFIFPPPPEPGLISAMTDGRKTVKAFVRDVEALRLDPVSSHVLFSQGAEHKMLDFIRTGKEQSWGPGEISAFRSTVPFLSPLKYEPESMSLIIRSMPDATLIPLKLVFSRGDVKKSLDYVEFKRVRAGAEEIELRMEGEPALAITLVFPFNPKGTVAATLSTHMPGNSVKSAAEACEV